MAANPAFTATPRCGLGSLSAAEASRTAPTAVATVLTAGAAGSLLERVRVVATGTTTAGLVRLFVYDGSAYFLLHEVAVTAVTPSATVAAFYADWTPPGGVLPLPAGYSLRAATEKAEAFKVIATGGDL